MNRKQKIIVSVTGIFIVLLILVGLTYAYFLTRIQGNTNTKSISVTTADLKLTYGDGNGDITAEKIEPGTVIDTKTFTVKNEGNATVNNYAVYLEELVNTLSRTSDMVYTLTCTSSVSGKTCNGVTETSFPTQNGMLVTNNIDVKETQSYELKVEYKEMNVDQSEDMNKSLSAKVQIYNLSDIVDITGTVTNASTGDYVEMQSTPKTSQIRDNKYFIPAVEPGVHTLYVKDSKGTVKGSKQITINKGSESSINGDTITVTSDSQTISLNITNISSTLTTDIGDVEDYADPYSLSNIILTNAKNVTNEEETLGYAKYRDNPVTSLGNSTLSSYLEKGELETITRSINLQNSLNYSGNTIYYASDYSINTKTGKFSAVNVSSCTVNYDYDNYEGCNDWNSYLGKYILVTSEHGFSSGSDFSNLNSDNTRLAKIIEANSSTIKFKEVYPVTVSSESTLTKTNDEYGTSYYFRGGVKNNYLDFAGMCWRIVRIQGDNSVKLILYDATTTCSSATGDWVSSDLDNILFTNNNSTYEFSGKYLLNWQNKKLNNYLSKLKIENWCFNSGGRNINLNCSNDNNIEYQRYSKFSDGTDMYVGGLTNSEVLLAGEKSFYLYEGRKDVNWYTLSLINENYPPNYLENGELNINGDPTSYNGYTGWYIWIYQRPVIVLANTNKIINGNGTKENPYVVS